MGSCMGELFSLGLPALTRWWFCKLWWRHAHRHDIGEGVRTSKNSSLLPRRWQVLSTDGRLRSEMKIRHRCTLQEFQPQTLFVFCCQHLEWLYMQPPGVISALPYYAQITLLPPPTSAEITAKLFVENEFSCYWMSWSSSYLRWCTSGIHSKPPFLFVSASLVMLFPFSLCFFCSLSV